MNERPIICMQGDPHYFALVEAKMTNYLLNPHHNFVVVNLPTTIKTTTIAWTTDNFKFVVIKVIFFIVIHVLIKYAQTL